MNNNLQQQINQWKDEIYHSDFTTLVDMTNELQKKYSTHHVKLNSPIEKHVSFLFRCLDMSQKDGAENYCQTTSVSDTTKEIFNYLIAKEKMYNYLLKQRQHVSILLPILDSLASKY